MSEATRTSSRREEEAIRTVMTFAITTHLAGRHPGVVKVHGRLGGSNHDVGGHEGIRLYEGKPGEEGAAYHIAEAIHAEETRLRQSHSLHDARFDFSSPCEMYFFQKREEGPTSRKREIASLSLPGGQSREEVCHAIASALVSGWERPPDAAYIPPERLTSERGTIIYGRDGHRLTYLVTFEYNGRAIEAPVVFVAWCTGTMRFATIHPGFPLGTGIAARAYYRYFTLLETDRGWLLCDDGTHDLDKPLAIADRGTANTWFYVMPGTGFPLTIRYDDQATSPPFSWETRDEDHFEDLIRRINTAVTTCSLYCSECRRGWLWDSDVKDLHTLREKRFLLTLCTHCWYCVDCDKWSTPTSREARYERFPCLHARPSAPEQRLQVQDWHMAKKWRAGRIRAQLPHFVQELPPPGESEYDVFITFHSPWLCTEKSAQDRPEWWKTVDIPAETRFVGVWDHRQPQSSRAYRVVLDNKPWSIPADLVSICCPITKRATPRAQFEIAQDSLMAAAELEAKVGEEATLRQMYARALIELAISGAPASWLAPARHRYAHLLILDGQVGRASQEMELAAREYGRSFAEFSNSPRDVARFDWELQAVDALIALSRLYLQQGKPAGLLWETAKRIRAFESEISKYPEHRATLIELKLTAAHLFAESDDAKEATQLQRQVENLLRGAPKSEQERYTEALSSLRAALHPEDNMLACLRDALAAHRRETLAQVREQEDALLSKDNHMQWRDQVYSIYLRANRPSRPRGAVDLQQNHRGMGSYTLLNGADLRVFELAQRGPLVAGRLLAELILSDLEARHGEYHWDRAIDYGREMTFIVSLSVGIGVADGGMRALRYALFPYGECVFPGGVPRPERIALLADVLELGVRLLALALPDSPGAAQIRGAFLE